MPSPLYRVLDAGTTASGAVCDVEIGESSVVDNPVSTVNNSAEMPESSAVDNPADNSASVDVDLEDNVNASTLDETGLEVNVNVVNGDSYSARTAGLREPPRSFSVHNNAANELPDRPRSAFFTPSRSTSARSVFDALRLAEIESQEIACMQRRMNGEVIITFKHPSSKEKFLRLNALKIGAENYAIQDIDRPLTFLTIYDAPFELADLAIIRRLAPYCEVLHYRRGRFSFAPSVSSVYNGLRHYRVRVIKPIPSFLRFGKTLLFLRHDGQAPTCRRCNQPGHFGNQCSQKICFNCENLGHESPSCPAPVLCSICKSDGHLGKQCPYSWYVPSPHGSPSPEPRLVDVDSIQDCASLYATPQWMIDMEISCDESEENLVDETVSEITGVDEDPSGPSSAVKNALDSQGFVNDSDPSQPSPAVKDALDSQVNDSDPPQPSPVVKNALDSQGFVNDSDPPTVFASRPSPPESLASETTPAPAAIVPEVVALDSRNPPEPAEMDLGSAADDAASASERTAAAGTSADPVSVSMNPAPAVRKILGRRAPALLTEPINFLSRVRTSPVLVTSRSRSTPVVATSSADASEEDMDTSSNLKRKPTPAKEKKGRKKGKK